MLREHAGILCEAKVHYWVRETGGLWGSRDLQFPGAVALFRYIERSQTGINERDSTRGTNSLAAQVGENTRVPGPECIKGRRVLLSRMQYGPRWGVHHLARLTSIITSTVTLLCSSPRQYRRLARALENTASNRGEEIGDNDRGRVKKNAYLSKSARLDYRRRTRPLSDTAYIYICTRGLDDIYVYPWCGAIPRERSSPT